MGQSVPEAEHGIIVVETDKDYYVSGREVNGMVHLYLEKEYPGENLNIEMKGEESSYWVSEDLSDPQNTHCCKKEFLTDTIPIFKFEDSGIQPGQYSFPFEIMIPDYCPSSCAIKECGNSGNIKYSLKAILKSSNPEIPDLTYKLLLTI